MKGILKVTSVNIVPGFIHSSEDANRYNGSRHLTHREYIAKCYEVIGKINDREVRFKSPTVLFTKTTGFLNHILMHGESNGWFRVEDGDQTIHHGHPMFDGGNHPNAAIDSHSKIVPLVKEGDEINIQYSIKSLNPNLSFDTIWRVKII